MTGTEFDKGMAIRRKVLGDNHVDAALARAEKSDFLAALQEIITTNGWGAVWGREGLDLKTRSMLTVAMLLALNRPHELALHIRGAINNGCSELEIREMIIHSGCYCGWPAAVDGFRVAAEVIQQLHSEKQDETGGKR